MKPPGILKKPTVRFDEDLAEEENGIQIPYLPPPPPPPPPLTDSHAFRAFEASYTRLPSPPPPPPPGEYAFSPLAPPPPDAPRPPSLFAKQIETDEYLSEPAYRLYTQFFDELSAFVNHQSFLITLRLNVQEKRTQLKRLREDISRCDIDFITGVRNCAAKERSLDDPKLMALFEAAQEARDHAGPAEAEYEPLELNLGAEEHKLREMYSKLELRFGQFFQLKADSPSHQTIPTKIVYEDPSEVSSASEIEVEQLTEPEDVAPFHEAWVGEQYPRRSQVTSFEAGLRRHRNNKESPRSSNAFSKRQSDGIAGNGQAKVSFAESLAGSGDFNEADIAQFRSASFAKDALQGVATLFSDMSVDTSGEAPALQDDFGSSPLVELDNALVLSFLPSEQNNAPQNYLRAFGIRHETLQKYLTSFEDTRDRVNRWLLHQLRLSRREVFLLQRHMAATAPETEGWADKVVSQWSNDDLGIEYPFLHGSIESNPLGMIEGAHHATPPQFDEIGREESV